MFAAYPRCASAVQQEKKKQDSLACTKAHEPLTHVQLNILLHGINTDEQRMCWPILIF